MTGKVPACRFCGSALGRMMLDLGEMPLANAFLAPEDLRKPEPRYPLRVRVCDDCLLVQADAPVDPSAIFSDYAYFSSYSDIWLAHARQYCERVTRRFALGPASHVVEIASNDGYLLRNFVAAGIPCLGIEPAENVAAVARAAGVPTRSLFLGARIGRGLAEEGGAADLVIANNVLAHVPDIDDFVGGLRALLKPGGVLTVEFPHLLRLVEEVQFDTIYHEHFSYLSLASVERIFAAHGLGVFDVEHLPTHGGSLRLYARPRSGSRPETGAVAALRALEARAGIARPDYYEGFGRRVAATIASVRRFLDEARQAGRTVVAYGAAAKGNTLLNACRVTADDIAYAVDRSPHKQGRYLPGTRLPIHAPERVAETRPDFLLILPWNLRDEIAEQMRHVLGWGGRFATAIPELRVFPA